MARGRLVIAGFVLTAALVGLVALLRREDTRLPHLVFCGATGGAIAGLLWRGRRGLLVGLIAGAVVGLISPYLYIPFWLVFTLPPHTELDL